MLKMPHKKVTQRDRVLQFIKEYGFITRLLAATQVGCYELSSRIGELEADGYKFSRTTKTNLNRYGDKIHYTEYRLVE